MNFSSKPSDRFLNRYELVLTEDGSPTFKDLISDSQESMHHRGGAYAETQLIYGNPLRVSLDAGKTKVLSVGLGLGYNEILMAHECLKRSLSSTQISLLSFESEEPLRKAFLSWVLSRDADQETQSVYDQILKCFDADAIEIKNWLQKAFEMKTWQMKEALSFEMLQASSAKVNCIFYDAFSSKTSPDLWTEEFLNLFFENFCEEICIVSTYACTGALKRSLKNQGFELVLKAGFKGKRLRTMGLRNFNEAVKGQLLDR